MHISPINFCGGTYHLYGQGETKRDRYKNLDAELKTACIARREGIDAPNYQALPFVSGEELGVKYTIKGDPASFRENPITEAHIDNLLQNFYLMDKMGLYHRNLSSPNIFYSKNGKVEIGSMREAAKYVREGGGFSLINDYELGFAMPSNAECFETQNLCRYLNQIKDEGQKQEFIRTYLQQKSDYHKYRAELLKSEGFKDTDEAVLYETAQSGAFKNPSDNVVNYIEDKLEITRVRKNAAIMWHKANGYLDGKINPKERFASVIMMLNALKSTVALRKSAEFLSETSNTPEERQYFGFEKELLDIWAENIYEDTRNGGADNFCNKDFGNGRGLFLGRGEDRALFYEFFDEIDIKGDTDEALKGIDTVIEYYRNLISEWTPEENREYKLHYLNQAVGT